MDSDLMIIFPGVIVMLIIIGLTINGVVSKILDYKHANSEQGQIGNVQSGKVNEIADRSEMIEDRLRVLERIATDRGQLLSDEIDALRGSITHENGTIAKDREPS